MRRYFFDVVSQGQATYDYNGSTFTTAQNAYQFAELIALDVAVKARDEFSEHTVYVRTEEGHTLFSACSCSHPLAAASKTATAHKRNGASPADNYVAETIALTGGSAMTARRLSQPHNQ